MYSTGVNDVLKFGVLADNANIFSCGTLDYNHSLSYQLQRTFSELGLPLKAEADELPVVWDSNRSFEVLGFTISEGAAHYPLEKTIAALLKPERSHYDSDKLQASRAAAYSFINRGQDKNLSDFLAMLFNKHKGDGILPYIGGESRFRQMDIPPGRLYEQADALRAISREGWKNWFNVNDICSSPFWKAKVAEHLRM
eukprot:3549636-Amphidinium_carterae.1